MQWWLCLLTLVSTAGCPGRITARDRFTDLTLAFSCPAEVDVARDIIAPNCASAGCHTSSSQAAGLDLESEGVAVRLYGALSTSCDHQLLLDPQNPFSGYFFDKIERHQPACGQPMPLRGKPLQRAQIECLHLWLGQQLEQAASE